MRARSLRALGHVQLDADGGACSRAVASRKVCLKATVTGDLAVAAVSNRTTTSCAST